MISRRGLFKALAALPFVPLAARLGPVESWRAYCGLTSPGRYVWQPATRFYTTNTTLGTLNTDNILLYTNDRVHVSDVKRLTYIDISKDEA